MMLLSTLCLGWLWSNVASDDIQVSHCRPPGRLTATSSYKSPPACQTNHCRAVVQHVLSAAKSDPLRMDRPELEV